MAIPIESFQDILDVLEQNPEYREAMRRHILDEEIRRLPAEFRELRKTVEELAQLVRDYIRTTDERLGRVESDVAELKEGQARLETDVAELKEGQARLEAGQVRLEGRIGDVAGTNYERSIAKHCRNIVSRRLGIKRAKVLHSISVPDNETLDDLVYAASEAGSITDEQAYDLDLADLIVAGVGPSGQMDYAVIEVSETIDDSDVDRARARAAILSKAAGESVVAAVIGKAVSDANRQRADRSGVTVIIMAE